MSSAARERIESWTLGTGMAAAVLGVIADHADDYLEAHISVADIARELEMKPSGVELILFLAANQKRVTAIVEQSGVVGYRLLEGAPEPVIRPLRRPEVNYHEYLRSDRWQEIRQRKLLEVDFRCQLCNSDRDLQLHHRTYERLGHEHMSDLTVLCATCHTLFHQHGKLSR